MSNAAESSMESQVVSLTRQMHEAMDAKDKARMVHLAKQVKPLLKEMIMQAVEVYSEVHGIIMAAEVTL